MTPLYDPHPRALRVLHGDLENYALGQAEVFLGPPGSVVERANASGYRFYAHQSYDGAGKRIERYVAGAVGQGEADEAAARLQARIEEMRGLLPSLRLLGREGFQLLDRRTYALMAALHNHGVFRAGGVLIGSHAYGILLNRLGIRTAAYSTQDVDLARPGKLQIESTAPPSLLEILRESGADLVEVPALDRKKPSTSFKEKGESTFRVELLAPGPDKSYPTLAVPELQAHAAGLPFLAYLLAGSQMATAMARQGCCALRVPLPERFVVHKLVASRLRVGRTAKSDNDVQQACVLATALVDSHPGALEEAVEALPKPARKHLRSALRVATPILEAHESPAVDELHLRG